MGQAVVSIAAQYAALAVGGIPGLLVAYMIMQIGSQLFAPKQKLDNSQRQHMVRSATYARQTIYGRAMVSGPLAFARSTKPIEYDPMTGAALKRNEYLHLIVLLAGHEVDAIEDVYFNDKPCAAWDKFGGLHKVRIAACQPGYGDYSPQGVDPAYITSITVTAYLYDGSQTVTTYDNVGSTVQAKLEADGYEVTYDYYTYITAATLVRVFSVSGITFSVANVDPVVTVIKVGGDRIYRINRHLGTPNQLADSDLVAEVEEWTDAHRLQGIAYLYVRLNWNPDAWPTGIPNIKAIVRGKKVYDPRTALTAWSDNAALCTLDYVRSADGIGAPDAEINMASWIAAANVCDEDEVTPSGTTQKRYTTNGVLSTDASPVENLEQLRATMAGGVFDFMGVWYGYAGADIPATITLTDDDLRGPVRIRPRPSRQQLFNAVRGIYTEPTANWAETEFPIVTNPTYQAQDGGERIESDLDLPLVNDSVRAQRLAKIELERARQGMVVEFPAKLTALRVRPWIPIMVTIARAGFVAKSFTVHEWKLSQDFGIDLVLQEYAPGVWDWNSGDATTTDLAPNTNLTDPFNVDPPTTAMAFSGSEELLLAGDGTVHSRIRVSWGEPTDAMISAGGWTEVEYRRHGAEGSWKPTPRVTGIDRDAFIAPVIDGADYEIRLRFVSALGVPSEWYYLPVHTVIGKAAPPSDISTFSAEIRDRQIYLQWARVPDVDVHTYEIRRGGTDWFSAEYQWSGNGDDLFREALAGDSVWRIKAKDDSGNYSLTEATANIPITLPAMTSLTAEVIDNNVLFRWTANAGTLPIKDFEVRKGDTFSAATVIGTVAGGFHPHFETSGGTYTYWFVPRDIADNYGTERPITTVVMQPPAYILNVNWVSTFSGTKTNMAIDPEGDLVGSINTTESVAQHFDNHAWASPQDQINAGYPVYIEPAQATASYVETFDYGAQLDGSMISINPTIVVVRGSPVFTYQIEVSADNANWTVYANLQRVFANIAFRYVRVTISVSNGGIYEFTKLEVRLDAKEISDGGMGYANASDTGGTTVSFAQSFVHIHSLTVTPKSGGTAAYGLYDFTQTANPSSFKTLLYDINGNRVSGDFSWTARGY